MSKFEIHCHTRESSHCARESAEAVVKAYAAWGYDGVVITDHFVIGDTDWQEMCAFQQAGYKKAVGLSEQYGITVLYGTELTVRPYSGNDFLVFGLSPEWFENHPQLADMNIKSIFDAVHEAGGFISHAHPFREADYIKTIALFPRKVDAVEVNANRTDFENERAVEYAHAYGLPITYGSDNHIAHNQKKRNIMYFENDIKTNEDLVKALFDGAYTCDSENETD